MLCIRFTSSFQGAIFLKFRIKFTLYSASMCCRLVKNKFSFGSVSVLLRSFLPFATRLIFLFFVFSYLRFILFFYFFRVVVLVFGRLFGLRRTNKLFVQQKMICCLALRYLYACSMDGSPFS